MEDLLVEAFKAMENQTRLVNVNAPPCLQAPVPKDVASQGEDTGEAVRMKPVRDFMWAAVQQAFKEISFEPLVDGIAESLQANDIPVDRIHLPMNKVNGFHHPVYAHWDVFWENGDGSRSAFGTHDSVATQSGRFDLNYVLRDSPYLAVSVQGQKIHRINLDTEHISFGPMRCLKNEGFTDYLAIGIELPNDASNPQPLSIATRKPGGFGPDIEEQLLAMERTIGMAIFALYQAAVSYSVAKTYIGHRTGPRVLTGDINRGSPMSIDAGILFCDVRDFTAMSERFATDDVVMFMNRIFDCIGEATSQRGGEILKFIGDAVLIVFSRKKFESDAVMARNIIEAVEEANVAVSELSLELPLDVSVGYGAHVGKVVYGNIGTADRLDFTVMGPAVNIAARLESLTKKIGAVLAVSEALAQFTPELTAFGTHELKGISDPVAVWGLPDPPNATDG